MKKKLPNNLLLECFALGMSAMIEGSMIKDQKEVARFCEERLDTLAKKFGFQGLQAFDKELEG